MPDFTRKRSLTNGDDSPRNTNLLAINAKLAEAIEASFRLKDCV